MIETSTQKAKLLVGDKTVEFPIVVGTEKETGVDVTSLRKETGAITLDPGFANTGACSSGITFLNGEKGILHYRGIPIKELANHSTYPETCYLLIYGSLPTQKQLDPFAKGLMERAALPKEVVHLTGHFPNKTHPMAFLSSATVALSEAYPKLVIPNPTPEQMDEVILTLLAQVPTLAAYGYRRKHGLPTITPKKELSYEANFLHMLFGSSKKRQPDEVIVQAMRQILILHADHEQNCSTSTVRLVGSSRANAFAAIASGMGALWGPLHGGANEAVIAMLEQIHRDGGDFSKYLEKAKDKDSGFRLMGFGHRVYKNFDPRAQILKGACDHVLEHLGIDDPLLEIAKRLEAAAIQDDYFVSKKLYPNVDFYSGIILRAIGIPTDCFTVIFALGRMGGWLAHWREMLLSPDFKIGRPRQVYTGPTGLNYVPLDQRG